MPIDGSTVAAMEAFYKLYSVTGDALLLHKARALADSVTNMQNPRIGMIPTHWMLPSCIEDGGDMWINCMIHTANHLYNLADYLDSIAGEHE